MKKIIWFFVIGLALVIGGYFFANPQLSNCVCNNISNLCCCGLPGVLNNCLCNKRMVSLIILVLLAIFGIYFTVRKQKVGNNKEI